MAVEMDSSVVDRVRIPSNLKADLDQFFSLLKVQVLAKAVRRAAARTTTDVCVLQKDDVLATAQEAFTEAAIGLNQALLPNEPSDVRRACTG